MTLTRDDLKVVRQRKYLAHDFDSLRANLLEYARVYYPDRIRDFSESSLGGLYLDLAAYVGDNLSFYLDHQYGELNPDTAVEQVNIQRQLNAAGVPIVGASPAIVQGIRPARSPRAPSRSQSRRCSGMGESPGACVASAPALYHDGPRG